MATANWRQLRILALLLILLFVALTTAQNRWRTTDWDDPLWVAVYPINGDGSAAAAQMIAALQSAHFEAVERFMEREAQRFEVALRRPVQLHLAQTVAERPPPPPQRNWWQVAWWSLKVRWWAWRVTADSDVPADVDLFVVFHDPATHPVLQHSYGLEKALLGVVNAYASQRLHGRNQVVIAHELLHTLGATDKYDPATSLPVFPLGYAELERQPPLPQRWAEIMGGRIPRSAQQADIPDSLRQVIIGPLTAQEIGWR